MASLLVFRRDAASEVAPLVVNTTTTAAADLVSFTCAAMVNANAGGGNQFVHSWAYLNATTGPNLSAQRAILNQGGYDNDSGSFTVARAFATSVTEDVGFEIHSRIPAVTDELGRKGWREIVNEVLSALPPIDLLPVTGVTAQSAYDVTATYPWLTDRSQILGIYFQDVGDDYPRRTAYRWDWLYDADSPRLLLPSEPFTDGQTFYIKARRPAQTWIKTGGVWGADPDGLQDDSDEALPLRSLVKAHALSIAYRLLGSQPGPDEYVTYYREREQFWTTKAYALAWWDRQQSDEDSEPRVRMAFFGPRFGSPRSYR